jgi:hypothetical protein
VTKEKCHAFLIPYFFATRLRQLTGDFLTRDSAEEQEVAKEKGKVPE